MKKSLALLLALSFGATSALAQSYPAKQIKFVVGFPAGSSIDVVSRIVLDDIRERTGATIVIDNKAGALGAIGLGELVKADADGYTLMPSSSAPIPRARTCPRRCKSSIRKTPPRTWHGWCSST